MAGVNYKNFNVLRTILNRPWHPTLISLFSWMSVHFTPKRLVIIRTHGTDNKVMGLDFRASLFENPVGLVEEVNKFWSAKHRVANLNIAIGESYIRVVVDDTTFHLNNSKFKED